MRYMLIFRGFGGLLSTFFPYGCLSLKGEGVKIGYILVQEDRQQALRAYRPNSFTVPKRPRTWPPKTIYEKPSEFSTVMAMDISQGMK